MASRIDVRTNERETLVDITGRVQAAVAESGIADGWAIVYCPHTTAGITVNEGADPAVQRDIITFLNKKVPTDFYYTHSEGNSDAHIKASLTGSSLSLIVEGGKPLLGTWQAVFFCEFDGPRPRKVGVTVVPQE